MKTAIREALRRKGMKLEDVEKLLNRSTDYVSKGLNNGTLKVHEALKLLKELELPVEAITETMGGKAI